jgi:uncharacterized C2H2 Zn-finger protein
MSSYQSTPLDTTFISTTSEHTMVQNSTALSDYPPFQDPAYQQDPSAQSAGNGSSNSKFRCEYCSKEHSKQFELTKHLRTHTKPLTCDRCPEAFAQAKDLNRHLWSNHPVYAAENNIPKDEKVCADCGLVCRSDNYKRHQQRYGHGPYRT